MQSGKILPLIPQINQIIKTSGCSYFLLAEKWEHPDFIADSGSERLAVDDQPALSPDCTKKVNSSDWVLSFQVH